MNLQTPTPADQDARRRRRLQIVIYVFVGIPLLGFVGFSVWQGQTPVVPVYVLNDNDAAARVTLCSTTTPIPPRTRAELRVRCFRGGGELRVDGGPGASERQAFADAAPAGLVANLGGRSRLALADYSRGYRAEQLVETHLPGMGAEPPGFLPPTPLGGTFLTVLPPSQPLLLPGDALPARVRGEGAVLRLEEVAPGSEPVAFLQQRFLDTPVASAPRTRGWRVIEAP